MISQYLIELILVLIVDVDSPNLIFEHPTKPDISKDTYFDLDLWSKKKST
jgi:hypothetical protein